MGNVFCRLLLALSAAGRPSIGQPSCQTMQIHMAWGHRCHQAILSGSLAILSSDCWVGFRPIFGQTWPQNPSRTTGLVLQCRLHHKSAPQTNSKAITWQLRVMKPNHNVKAETSDSNVMQYFAACTDLRCKAPWRTDGFGTVPALIRGAGNKTTKITNKSLTIA